MNRNSTLGLLTYLLQEEHPYFDKLASEILLNSQIGPKKQTINNIIAYAKAVKGIHTKSRKKILICLN